MATSPTDPRDPTRHPARGQWHAALITWGEPDLDEQTASDWARCGIRADEANSWLPLTPDPMVAMSYLSLGWKARHAAPWIACQFTGPRALNWSAAGFDSVAAAAWESAGFGAAEAARWVASGIADPADADLWGQHGFDAAGAAPWIARGHFAADAEHWRACGFTPDRFDQFMRAGYVDVFQAPTLDEGLADYPR